MKTVTITIDLRELNKKIDIAVKAIQDVEKELANIIK